MFSSTHNSNSIDQPNMSPKRGKKRAASECPTSDDSGVPEPKKTTCQREMRMCRHMPAPAPAPASGIRAQQVPCVLRGSDVLTRTLLSHSTQLRSTTRQGVSVDSTLRQLDRQNEIIEALRLVEHHERNGILTTCGPHRPVVTLPPEAEYKVNTLFAGKAIAGRHWKCEVERHTNTKTNFGCAIYWLVDESTNERRWFGATSLSAQLDMTLASQIGLDIASAANRFPGKFQDMSKERVPSRLASSSTMHLILEAATRRQDRGRQTLLAPTFRAEEDGHYIQWTASCIDPSTFQRWALRCVISLDHATQAPSWAHRSELSWHHATPPPNTPFFWSPPYFPNIQFTTKARTSLRCTRQTNGMDSHRSTVPEQIPNISKAWTSPVDKRAAILQAERLAQALVAIMDGKVIDRAGAKAMIQYHSNPSKQIFRGGLMVFVDGSSLYDVRRDDDDPGYKRPVPSVRGCVLLDPRSRHLPAMRVTEGGLMSVCRALNRNWLMTGSVAEARIAGAKDAEEHS
jgi:hypothetical protein